MPQKFFQFGHLSMKISGCANGLGLIMVFKKSGLGLEKVVLVLVLKI